MVIFMQQFPLESASSLSFSKYLLDRNYVDNSLHYHSDLEISYVRSGRCIYCIDDQFYEVKAGDIVVIKGFLYHYIQTGSIEEPFTNLVIMANSHFVRHASDTVFDHLGISLLSKKENVSPIYHDEEIAKLFCSIEKLLEEKNNLYLLIAKCELLTLFARVISSLSPNSALSSDPHEKEIAQKINTITAYIDDHILEKLKLDDLADMVDLNPAYLSSYFKKHTGISITEYILQNRISLSIKKLQTTQMNITEIAFLCGFNNTANFNKAFRKIIGKTPSELRRIGTQTESSE